MSCISVQSSAFPITDKQEYVTLVDDRQFFNPRGRDDRRLAKEAHDHFPFTMQPLPPPLLHFFSLSILYAVNSFSSSSSIPRHAHQSTYSNRHHRESSRVALLNIPGKLRKLVAAPTFHNIFPAGIDEWNCDSFMSNTQKRLPRPIDPLKS